MPPLEVLKSHPGYQVGWQTVTYRRGKELSEEQIADRDRKRQLRAEEEERIRADPVASALRERKHGIWAAVRRLERTPKFYGWTRKQIRDYLESQVSYDRVPTIICKDDPDADPDAPRRNRDKGGRARRVERNAEEGKLQLTHFTKEFVDQVKAARAARQVAGEDGEMRPMTQADLARLVSRTANEIKAFEAGEMLFDGQLKTLLMWKLGMDMSQAD
jgi:hypothetical protein